MKNLNSLLVTLFISIFFEITLTDCDKITELKNTTKNGLNIEIEEPTKNSSYIHLLLKNTGENEMIDLKISDKLGGHDWKNYTTSFPLAQNGSREIFVEKKSNSKVGENEKILIEANGKKSRVSRTIQLPGSDLEWGGGVNGPFCYDRYVTGTCRYRTDPEYCYQYEWTAYAIVKNLGGGVESEPPGLAVEPGNIERLRAWVKVSCCVPFVNIVSLDLYGNVHRCTVDVRELQWLHPGEIVGIVLGVLLFLIILIVGVILVIRKRRSEPIAVDNDCQFKSYKAPTPTPSRFGGVPLPSMTTTSSQQNSSRFK